MKKKRSLQICFLLHYFLSILTDGQAVHHYHHHHRHRHRHRQHVKLFVFGDSYADTGNWPDSAISWKNPYGITFPGKPSGRFSDGRVLTDYIASYMGIGSPIPYERRKIGNESNTKFGMNFAYGGTGVFDTLNNKPNLVTQIKFFQQLLQQNVYTKHDLNSSIALVSVAGNDYNTYLYKHGNDLKDMGNFTASIMNELSKNLKKIHELGVQKLAITSLQPIGCLPAIAVSSSFKNCSEKWNDASKFHNQMLQQQLQNLNNDTNNGHVFQLLDLFGAFMSAFNKSNNTGALDVNKSPMKACCEGITSNYSCGDVDKNGEKKYVICKNPELSIFWDMVHPSQNGWHQVHSALLSSLHQLLP